MSSRVVLITGANSGVGFALVHRLLREAENYETLEIVMACRSRERAQAARVDVLKEFPNAHIHILLVDVSNTLSCFKAAQEFKARFNRIDYFFANAGMIPLAGYNWVSGMFEMVTSPKTFFDSTHFLIQRKGVLTNEGLGEVFAANVFGHYILIRELTDLMANSSEGCHVIWTSSHVALFEGEVRDDYQCLKQTDPYEASKYICDLVSLGFDKEFCGSYHGKLRSFSTTPGVAMSNIGTHMIPKLLSPFVTLAYVMASYFYPQLTCDPAKGAESNMYVYKMSKERSNSREHNALIEGSGVVDAFASPYINWVKYHSCVTTVWDWGGDLPISYPKVRIEPLGPELMRNDSEKKRDAHKESEFVMNTLNELYLSFKNKAYEQ